jgi:hypothetical protein
LTPFVARRIFAILAATSFVVIMWLGLGMTFFADEWAFIEKRSLGDPATWWAPHNEHWTTLSVLVYRLLVETVGLGSYVPYLAVAVGLHVVVCALVYRLLERSSGPLFALIGSAIVLFFGSGFENLFWAFQIGSVGSVAFGLAALLVMDGRATWRRAGLVAVLMLASLASSAFGIGMCVAIGLEWLVVRRWQRYIPAMLLPAGAFLIWFLAVGRAGLDTFGVPLTLEAASDVPRSVMRGLSNGFGAIAGLPAFGFIVLTGVLAAGTIAAARGVLAPRAITIILGMAVQYALTGFARAQLYDGVIDYTNYTRYTYVAGVIALVAVGAVVARVELPKVGRRRLAAVAVLGAWAAVALVTNVGLLMLGRDLFLDHADMTRALVTVALEPDRPAEVDPDRSLVLVPSPASLTGIAAAYGDPRTDRLVPWAVRPIPPEYLAEAQRRLVEGAPIPGFTR